MTARSTHAQVALLRQRAQLLHSAATDPAAAVGHLLAMQAQDWLGSLWAVGTRSDASAADVIEAQASGRIVRSWPMRGTLHWTLAEDIGWLTAMTRDRMERRSAGRHRELGLDPATFARTESIVRSRLTGIETAERAELLQAFADDGVAVDGQRGPHLLGWLAQHAVVVMVSRTGYALHEEWVREPRELSRDEALAELALRYFHSHGPATVHDLSWWASITVTEARAGLAAVRDQLDELIVEQSSHYLAPGLEQAPPSVCLLPGFDESFLGYRDRTAPLGGEPLERIVPGRNGMFLATVTVDGVTAATWKRKLLKDRVVVTLDPWRPISRRRMAALDREVERYGEHLGVQATLRVTGED